MQYRYYAIITKDLKRAEYLASLIDRQYADAGFKTHRQEHGTLLNSMLNTILVPTLYITSNAHIDDVVYFFIPINLVDEFCSWIMPQYTSKINGVALDKAGLQHAPHGYTTGNDWISGGHILERLGLSITIPGRSVALLNTANIPSHHDGPIVFQYTADFCLANENIRYTQAAAAVAIEELF